MIGTTGFDVDALRDAAGGASANAFVAPNFAIGAVLMMRFAAEASRHMQGAEIIESARPWVEAFSEQDIDLDQRISLSELLSYNASA